MWSLFFRAFYTRRKFRPIYAKVMNKTQHLQRNSTSFVRNYGNAMSLLAGALPSNANPCLFDYPFNELLVSIQVQVTPFKIMRVDTNSRGILSFEIFLENVFFSTPLLLFCEFGFLFGFYNYNTIII